MDGAAPFQPWTRADGTVNVKDERESMEDAISSQYDVSRPKHFQNTSLTVEESLEPALDPTAECVTQNAAGTIMDGDKMDRMQQIVENTLSPESRQNVTDLLSQVESLSGAEKLFLYLRLPTGPPVPDPLKQPLNPLGSRSEIHQTVLWIQTHLEVDAEVSLPKQDVYDEYTTYCMSTNMKMLSTADFGKVMKQVYPCVRPRRLGTRGNSRYCYAGLRKKVKLEVPQLPDLGDREMLEMPTAQNELLLAASHLIRDWAGKMLGIKFLSLCELAQHLLSAGGVDASVLQPRARRLLACAPPPAPLHLGAEVTCQTSPNSQQASPATREAQRGVIKQLKRKIQSQPKISKSEKKTKIQEQNKTANPDNYLAAYNTPPHPAPAPTPATVASQQLATSPITYLAPPSSITHHVSSPVAHITSLSTPHRAPLPSSHHLSPSAPHDVSPGNSHLPPLTPHIKVESLMSPPPRPYYHTQTALEETYKPPPTPTPTPTVRQHNYRHVTPYYVQEHPPVPQNLIFSSSYPVNYSHHPSYSPIGSNVPINLSSNSGLDCSQTEDFYKAEGKEPVDVLAYNISAPDNASLNLSTTTRQEEWRLHSLPPLAPQHRVTIPPLPGKKMILEAYNNETLGSPRSTYSPQSLSKATYSPGKDINNYSTAEYLPKKMRAVESWSGKLAAARVAVQADGCSPDRYHTPPAPRVVSRDPPTSTLSIMDTERRQYVSTEQPAARVSPVKTEFSTIQTQYVTVDSPLVTEVTVSQDFLAQERKDTNHFQQNAVEVVASKSGAKTSEESIEPLNRPVRGRPKKKTLVKAKYTKKQHKGQQQKFQCDHKDKDNCSTDCSVLAEEINKTGVICKEKHSEILNRERVISICNLDKHALDDYLNEGNSQEHEEELMQYFHHSDSQSNDGQFKGEKKESLIAASPENKAEHSLGNTNLSTSKNQSETLTNHFLGSNLDLHDEHSQGKNEKISELRALLAKNLHHRSIPAQAPTGGLNKGTITQATAEPSPTDVLSTTRTTASAFKAIGGPNITFLNEKQAVAFKEGSAAASLNMLSQRQQNMASDKLHPSMVINRNLNAARRVSFETPHSSQGLIITSSSSDNVPQSPTSRTNNFNFVPISTNCHSPSNKLLLGNISKHTVSPTKGTNNASLGSRTNSPINSTNDSPFVSPRNTPVPRARLNCQKPIPSKTVSKKGCKVNNSGNIIDSKKVGFAVPTEQNYIPKSPGVINRLRNLPMSAPPSPNILVSRYKPNCANNQALPTQDCHSKLGFNNVSVVNTNAFATEINNGENSQPMSADAFSNEVSQFFTDCVQPYTSDSNVAYRSQSVPLNKNTALSDGNSVPYFECDRGHQNHRSFNTNMFLSYNNTPCNSVPQTPIPQEFCDFGSFTETCESISKACLNSESLDKIYNVLDKTAQENGLNVTVEGKSLDNPLLNSITDNTLELSNSAKEQSRTNVGFNESLSVNGDAVRKENQFASLDTRIWVFNNSNSSGQSDQLKRSSSIDFDLNELVKENKFYSSRSVPNTPLPYHRTIVPDANNFIGDADLLSKSVPSTPLLPEERRVFSYANRDFLINGNSVDTASTNNIEEDPVASKMERVLESPLQGIVTFAEDCMVGISADLPFSEQGITNDNDLLEDLDKIGSQAYNEL